MAASELKCAISYALRSIGKPSIQLKNEQEEALASVYKGQDTFVWLPTGYGKSICYECLPFLYDFKLKRK
jgi:ATP-dependent DNA helicase RecQ